MSSKESTKVGSRTGAVLGGVAGALSIGLSNPVGRWTIFTAKDEIQLQILRGVEKVFGESAGNWAYRTFGLIANTIIAYPYILPIAGGVLAAGIGALIGKKIAKSKLNHKSLSTKSKTYVKK